MASIDHERKRISAAVLLFGPPGAGKTTAMYGLARQLPDGTHGKVAPLNQGDGRLLRLDYRPHDQELVYGYQVNFRLVACPGAIEVDLLRPMLGAVDAVLFVADSAKSALKTNVKALELLDRMIRSTGRTLSDLPMVFLYNKRDLREAVEIRQLEERLNKYGCSYVAASAIRGQGVMDAMHRLTASVAVQVRSQVQATQGTEGAAPSNARTVAHGTTFQQARAVHGEGNDDHTAVSSHEASGVRWEGDDDRTEVNVPGGTGEWADEAVAEPGDLTRPSGAPGPGNDDITGTGDWTRPTGGQARAPAQAAATASFRELRPLEPESAPAPQEPLRTNDRWRTPAAFAEDVDSDDHTMPFRGSAGFGGEHANADDITETGVAQGHSHANPAGPRSASLPHGAAQSAAAHGSLRPTRPQVSAGRPPARAQVAPSVTPARARRVEARPAAPPPQVAAPPFVAPAHRSPSVDNTQEGGALESTATQVINSLGRQPEAWESGIEQTAHRMRVPVPDLAGYVVSRIGTPKASTRRTVQVPVRATHMDTLMPQDFVLDIEFRGGPGGSVSPAVSARRSPDSSSETTVPLSWMVGMFGVSLVAIVAVIFFFVSRMG